MIRIYDEELRYDSRYMEFANKLHDLVDEFMQKTNASAISFDYYSNRNKQRCEIEDLRMI